MFYSLEWKIKKENENYWNKEGILNWGFTNYFGSGKITNKDKMMELSGEERDEWVK